MKTTQTGFTLIELMIVVVIIGILAAIAVPAYSDYTGRTQVTEALSLSSGVRTAVSEFRINEGKFPSTHTQVGLPAPGSIKGKYVASVDVDAGGSGLITATMAGSNVLMSIANKTMLLSPVSNIGSIEWKCKAGTLDPRFLPTSCRI